VGKLKKRKIKVQSKTAEIIEISGFLELMKGIEPPTCSLNLSLFVTK